MGSVNRKPKGYWNVYEHCHEEAKKYSSKKAFYKGNWNAYRAAIRNKWIDGWFENQMKEPGFWTKETCYEAAKECKSRSEFEKKYGRAYTVSLENGYINEYTWFKRRIHINDEYLVYAYEDKNNKSVYVGLTLMNRLSIRHSEHKRQRDIVTRYFESLQQELPDPIVKIGNLKQEKAQYYEDLYVKEYENNGWTVLNVAKTGIGISSVGGGNIIWEYENAKEMASKCKTKEEFRKKFGGAWNAAVRNKWLTEWFGKYDAMPNGYWTKEKCIEEGKKHRTRSEFAKAKGAAYDIARVNGWLDEMHFEETRKPCGYWTYDRCKEEAKKHHTQTSFKEDCSSAYNVAYANGWLKEYTWFEEGKKPNGYWHVYEHCKEAASKCRTKSEFSRKHYAGWDWSKRNGWLDEFFPHKN